MKVQYSDLKDKRILITGATRGIGRAIAESLASQQAHIVFNYREGKEVAAEELSSALMKMGAASAIGLPFDITDSEKLTTELNNYTQTHGLITGLVNNAGISKDTLLLRLKPTEIDQIIDTNLKGAMIITQALTRSFLKAENVSIINMSSIVGMMGNASQAAYAASKAGLLGFTKSVAKELASKNIRCNAVCPGFIATDMTDALDDRVKEAYLSSIPLKRFGKADEVAHLVNFLLSQASGYMTGEVLKMDGGLYC
jgi:3-oxoacyl-[acyl-carrier protein] reductase